MEKERKRINYNLAKAEADNVDEKIIVALQNGSSFRVEAGAGSGKTYSLNKAIEWIQANKWAEYRRKKQTVVCITYTNAAVDVIAERLSKDSSSRGRLRSATKTRLHSPTVLNKSHKDNPGSMILSGISPLQVPPLAACAPC